MKRRLIFNILALCMLLTMLAPAAYATEAVPSTASGTCGDGLTWVYEDHTLTVSGSGDMDDGCPWIEFKDRIEHVVFTGGVTKVGAGAFEDFDWLETVDFGDSMREIGKRAFYDCNDISEIRLPATFRIFGEECFRNCATLQRVICEGGIMPSFKSACMHTGNFISVFYPPNNPWSWEYTSPVMSAYGGMVSFFMASEDIMENGFPSETEAAQADETTEATEAVEETVAAAAVAEETVPETTVAATEPVTVPTTEPETVPTETTVPETEATTGPVTEPVETAELDLFTEETEPETVVEEVSGSGWIGLVLIAGVLTFLIAGALIFRSASRRGGRYGE